MPYRLGPRCFAGAFGLSVVGALGSARTASREVMGQDCSAVVLSLVLIAALALSPPEGAATASSLAEPAAPAVNEPPRPTWLFGVSGRATTGVAPELSWGVNGRCERGERSYPSPLMQRARDSLHWQGSCVRLRFFS
jgi:hypothetical protein